MSEEDDRLTTRSHWEHRGDEITSNVDVGGTCIVVNPLHDGI